MNLKRIVLTILVITMLVSSVGSVFAEQYGPQDRISSAYPGNVTETPVENLFRVEGDVKNVEFTLLDTTDDDASKFFILTKTTFGTQEFDPDGTTMFDINDTNNIAHRINNESFKNNGFGSSGMKIPAIVFDYIDYNHKWLVEAGHPTSNCPKDEFGNPVDYEVTCGLALMAQWEFKKYIGMFGSKDGLSNAWWLRTSLGTKENKALYVSSATHGTTIEANPKGQWNPVRPVFYLNKDFFADVRLDTRYVGANVANAIRATYTKSEMSKIYTEKELVEVFGYPRSLSVEDVVYSDSSDAPITDTLAGATSLKITGNVYNNTSDDLDNGVVIAVVYDGNGALKAAHFANVSVEKENVCGFEVEFVTLPAGVTADYQVKTLLCKSLAQPELIAEVVNFLPVN